MPISSPTRRQFFSALAACAAARGLSSRVLATGEKSTAEAIEQAHDALWSKFVDRYGIILDYVGEIPTPEDCALGKPNAIGWWSPIENGPMFNGLYLPAACERARRTGKMEDREKCSRLAGGLIKCASVSEAPGFIARGIGSDGRCHYPLGSDDQTHPWFLGLYAYLKSSLPSASERERVIAKMREVADVLQSTGWRCPADSAFTGDFRGGFQGNLHRDAARYLFMLRVMHEITGEQNWRLRYEAAAEERPTQSEQTRAELAAAGYPHDRESIKHLDESQMWIYVGTQSSLGELAKLEPNPARKNLYLQGLALNAKSAFAQIEAGLAFDNNDRKAYGTANWRESNPTWFPQKTQADAAKLAGLTDREKAGPRKHYEASLMMNPLAAAAIAALGGESAFREPIERLLRHYDYSKLYMAQLFFAECAYYALPR